MSLITVISKQVVFGQWFVESKHSISTNCLCNTVCCVHTQGVLGRFREVPSRFEFLAFVRVHVV